MIAMRKNLLEVLKMMQIILYGLAITLTIVSFIKDKEKTKIALKKGAKAFESILATLLCVMVFIGISLAIIDENLIARLIGPGSGIIGILIAVAVGSITMMGGFIAFPLGATLLERGAGIAQVAGFISALMMVGFLTIALEKKYWGMKVTIIRNGLGIIVSILVALVVGWLH